MPSQNTPFEIRSVLDQETAVDSLGLLQGTPVQDDDQPRATSSIGDGEKLTTSEPANQPLSETPQITQATPPGNELFNLITFFGLLVILSVAAIRHIKRRRE